MAWHAHLFCSASLCPFLLPQHPNIAWNSKRGTCCCLLSFSSHIKSGILYGVCASHILGRHIRAVCILGGHGISISTAAMASCSEGHRRRTAGREFFRRLPIGVNRLGAQNVNDIGIISSPFASVVSSSGNIDSAAARRFKYKWRRRHHLDEKIMVMVAAWRVIIHRGAY